MALFKKIWLNTLENQTDKQIKESLYQNEYFLSHRWTLTEKNIVLWSTDYKKYVPLALVLAFLVAVNFALWGGQINSYTESNFGIAEGLTSWQGTMLSGQLTIIGVVYPLVIGLVSVLLQNKSGKRVIFPLYQKYSGFMFAGLSGIALAIFIVIGQFSKPVITDASYVAICITSGLWLISNLVLTAWFIVKSFRILDEKNRESIFFRFSINEVCEQDVRNRIKHLFLEGSTHQELIASPDREIMDVASFDVSDVSYEKITKKVKRGKGVKNVQFWLINFAIKIQVLILNCKGLNGTKLIVNAYRPSNTGNEMVVSKYNKFEINRLVKFLIKSAFSFEKNDQRTDIGLTTVLHGFIGPANDALREGDTREFSDAIDNIASWHAELAEALCFKNDEGNLDNWLLLSTSGFWGFNYLSELLREYHRIGREVVEKIPENSSFYQDMLRLHRRIFISRDNLLDEEKRFLIAGNYQMWYLLLEWRSYSSESGDVRVANKYEDILFDFVGAWESWLMFIEPRSKKRRDYDNAYWAYIAHIEFTASTAISALRFGNLEAAGWGVDMLVNWIDHFRNNQRWYVEFEWHSVLVNHCLLSVEEESSVWQSILKGNKYDSEAAFDIALNNAHIDVRLLTACYMLLKPNEDRPDILAQYVWALLEGKRVHPSASVYNIGRSISNAGEVLGAYFRHRDYGNYEKGSYGRWLSSILRNFGRIYEEKRVSGRIYTGWGAEDPASMKKAYVRICIAMSKAKWMMPFYLEDAIFSDFYTHEDRKAIVSDLDDWIKIAQEEGSSILIDVGDSEELKQNFIESVQEISKKINEEQQRRVYEASLDRERLDEIGVLSSSIFRDEHRSDFPIRLFGSVSRGVELDDQFRYRLNLQGYDKAKISLDIEDTQSINEGELFQDAISQNVKINILKAVLSFSPSVSYGYSDVENMLSGLNELCRSMDSPVLFVGNQRLQTVLRRSSFDRDGLGDYKINRFDGFGNEYICHLGECEVYELRFSDVDFCLLTEKDLFDTVHFRRLSESRYIHVDFEPNNDCEVVGKLIFDYWMKVDLRKEVPLIKFELYSDNGEGG